MKLVQHGTKYIQTIKCKGCGARYEGTHFDEGVKSYDTDYTQGTPNGFQYYFSCEDCKEIIEFNKKTFNIGVK